MVAVCGWRKTAFCQWSRSVCGVLRYGLVESSIGSRSSEPGCSVQSHHVSIASGAVSSSEEEDELLAAVMSSGVGKGCCSPSGGALVRWSARTRAGTPQSSTVWQVQEKTSKHMEPLYLHLTDFARNFSSKHVELWKILNYFHMFFFSWCFRLSLAQRSRFSCR